MKTSVAVYSSDAALPLLHAGFSLSFGASELTDYLKAARGLDLKCVAARLEAGLYAATGKAMPYYVVIRCSSCLASTCMALAWFRIFVKHSAYLTSVATILSTGKAILQRFLHGASIHSPLQSSPLICCF